MDSKIHTEVRGCRFFSPESMLIHAILSYSRHFTLQNRKEKVLEYNLCTPGVSPSLIGVQYFPKTNPLFVPNVVICFSSYLETESKKLATDFEKKSDLELLTVHEYKGLDKYATSCIESCFVTSSVH